MIIHSSIDDTITGEKLLDTDSKTIYKIDDLVFTILKSVSTRHKNLYLNNQSNTLKALLSVYVLS